MSADASRWGALEEFCPAGQPFATAEFSRLDPYVAELMRWNKTIRLVGPRDEEGIAAQVRDALAPFLMVPPTFPLLDIGSGAGLPAIALALLWRDRVVCIEPRRKRVTFLNHISRVLGLDKVEPVCARAQEALALRPELAGAFACVTARAVSDVETLLEWAVPYLAPGGVVVLGRGGQSPAEVEGWRLVRHESYVSPASGAPRSVVVYSRQ